MIELISRQAVFERLKHSKPIPGEPGSKEAYRYYQHLTDINAIKEVPRIYPAEIFCAVYQKDPDFRKAVKASILSAITDTKGSCSDEQLAENIANRLFGES